MRVLPMVVQVQKTMKTLLSLLQRGRKTRSTTQSMPKISKVFLSRKENQSLSESQVDLQRREADQELNEIEVKNQHHKRKLQTLMLRKSLKRKEVVHLRTLQNELQSMRRLDKIYLYFQAIALQLQQVRQVKGNKVLYLLKIFKSKTMSLLTLRQLRRMMAKVQDLQGKERELQDKTVWCSNLQTILILTYRLILKNRMSETGSLGRREDLIKMYKILLKKSNSIIN